MLKNSCSKLIPRPLQFNCTLLLVLELSVDFLQQDLGLLSPIFVNGRCFAVFLVEVAYLVGRHYSLFSARYFSISTSIRYAWPRILIRLKCTCRLRLLSRTYVYSHIPSCYMLVLARTNINDNIRKSCDAHLFGHAAITCRSLQPLCKF